MRYKVLNRRNDFTRTYARGKSYVHGHMVLYVNKNRQHHMRIGLTATKKIGNAVKRNRARRVMKAALDMVLPRETIESQGLDLVLVARGATPHLKSWKLALTLAKLLKKAQIPCDFVQVPVKKQQEK